MKIVALILTLLVAQKVPRNDPNGTWESSTGSKYELRLNGSNLQVKLVPGSNSKYIIYDVTLKNQEEINSYKGAGTFVAKMEGGKECKFETEWQLVVVSADRILGATSGVLADKETCAIKEKNQVQLDLKRVK